MSRRRHDRNASAAGSSFTASAGRMPAARLTSLGLGLVALGWMLQLAGGPLGLVLTGALGAAAPTPLGLIGIAQSLILSGFGLAILAALHTGFGALNRFFETIAQRSAAAAAKAPPAPPSPVVTVPERTDPNRINGRGRIADRAYVQFADGSVEVETLLGARRFNSFEEARAFVGA